MPTDLWANACCRLAAALIFILFCQTASLAAENVAEHQCDRLAADPVDYERAAPLVDYLTFMPEQAAAACRNAVAAYPDEPRFRLQLGRALLALRKFDEAKETLQAAADRGYAAANLYLGRISESGSNGAGIVEQAFEYYRAAAEQGHQDAQILVGLAYRDGKGREADPEQAFHWFKQAADQGNPRANFLLAAMYAGEAHNAVDPALKVQHSRMAAEHAAVAAEAGMPGAQFILANHYLLGVGLDKNLAKGLELLKAAAEQGHRVAGIRLGHRYMRGEDVPHDREQAIYWFCRAGASGPIVFQEAYDEVISCR